ncbi:glycoside hydrolase family 3 N-terminal domain-containing protein [Luteococcus sanguinis]|uniref:beta-N-acetylhexosaminidase n=1 Tax=Luteococcus sanguinis TaxID=174038 RepID=A0ABW1X2G4_9ACTN
MTRRVLAAVLMVPALALSACGGTGSSSTSADATTSAASSALESPGSGNAASGPTSAAGSASVTGASSPSCRSLAEGLDITQKVGQLFMVATTGATFDPDLRQVVEEFGIGSVLYLGQPPRGVGQVASMSARIQTAAGAVPIMVAVDQEGGQVQRLTGTGFDDIPSAAAQSELSPSDLTAKWTTWGKQLHTAGVRYDLAPVADLVPADKTSSNAPIGQLSRGYGSDEQTVATNLGAVIEGLHEAGIVTSAKHFPGIGRVEQNTDFAAATDSVTTGDDVATFAAAIAAGTDSIMVGSVKYDKIDPGVHAVFSRKIVTELLRDKLGWQGVVISDDIGAAEAVSDVPAAERGLRFIEAGGDIVINADAATMDDMVEAMLAKAQRDQAFAATLDDHVERVLELKSKAGLLECSR